MLTPLPISFKADTTYHVDHMIKIGAWTSISVSFALVLVSGIIYSKIHREG